MKIHQIKVRSDGRQHLCVTREADAALLTFNGQPKVLWDAVKFYIFNPLDRPPDFWHIGTSSAFAFDPTSGALGQLPLDALLDDAGERLPIEVEDGTPLVVLNVLTVANALDVERTTWAPYDQGRHRFVDGGKGAFQFVPNRVPETSIFKIPQNNAAGIFCCERDGDPDREFRAAVAQAGLTGLRFECVWDG